MMNIAYLVVIMAGLTSETWCQLAIDAPGRRAVLYRTGIHVILAEISKMCCLGSGLLGAPALEHAGKRGCMA